MMPVLLTQQLSRFTQALTGNRQRDDDEFIKGINPASRIPPQLALEIYRNNTRGARINALEVIYPACRNILGDDTFRAIAHGFVAADSTGASNLNHYGETFSNHMGMLLEAGRLPAGYDYLQDLAGLEYLYHAAYYADTDPTFDFELFELTVKNGQTLYFRLSASLGLLASRHPLYDIWLRNVSLSEQNGKTAGSHDVHALDDMQYLLVHRDHYTPVVTPISDHEYRILEALKNNKSLQAIIAATDCDIDGLLPGMITSKWIVGIKTNG